MPPTRRPTPTKHHAALFLVPERRASRLPGIRATFAARKRIVRRPLELAPAAPQLTWLTSTRAKPPPATPCYAGGGAIDLCRVTRSSGRYRAKRRRRIPRAFGFVGTAHDETGKGYNTNCHANVETP
jgi:hypothetical protein